MDDDDTGKTTDEDTYENIVALTDKFAEEMDRVLEDGFDGGSDLTTIETFILRYKHLRNKLSE